jgi:Ca2+-transporting ATPase
MEAGRNEAIVAKRRDLVASAVEVLREPMFLLLMACGAVYISLGDPYEALSSPSSSSSPA